MKPSFMNPDQLAALAAIADTGHFERAASTLGISTSAVSQRIRALEASVGRVLVRRASPSTMTDDGATVLRYARQQQLLAAELAGELGLEPDAPAGTSRTAAEGHDDSGGAPVELTLAVNADSLGTWFTQVLDEAASWTDVRLRILTDDETRTIAMLREGAVMAAVSTHPDRVPGCRAEALGTMRYEPVAAPALLRRLGCQVPDVGAGSPGATRSPSQPESPVLPGSPQSGSTSREVHATLAAMPVLRFDAADDLQDLALADAGLDTASPGPMVPGLAAYTAALEAGLGWGMLPAAQRAAHPRLVPVPGLGPVDRPLVWHRWTLGSPRLERLTQAVHAAFRDGKDPVAHGHDLSEERIVGMTRTLVGGWRG